MSIFCTDCGTQQSSTDAQFCENCGAKLPRPVAPAATPALTPQPVVAGKGFPVLLVGGGLVGLLAIGGLIALFFSGGVGSSPADVMKEFISALDRKDVDHAISLWSSGSRNPMMEGMFKMAVSMGDGLACSRGAKVKSMDTSVETIQGDTAYVEILLTCSNGQAKSEKNKLVRENGSWKVVVEK